MKGLPDDYPPMTGDEAGSRQPPANSVASEPASPRTLRVFTSSRTRRRTIEAFALIGLLFLSGSFLLQRYLPWITDGDALRTVIHSFGILAPLVFVVVQALQVVFAPIPGQLLGFAAGYLFGSVAGTAYSLLGAAIGSAVAFSLSRRYGRPFVEDVVYGPTLDAFDDVCRERGLYALFVIFLVPGIPDDVLCFAAGLTDLDVRKMVVVSVVGRLPGYLVVAVAGANLAAGHTGETVVLVGLVLVASAVGVLKRDRILGWLGAGTPTSGTGSR